MEEKVDWHKKALELQVEVAALAAQLGFLRQMLVAVSREKGRSAMVGSVRALEDYTKSLKDKK